MFHDWQLPALPIDPYAWNLPESPLVCLTPTFITLETDLNCRPHTLQLLEDMRYLTDLFVGEDTCSIQFDSIKLEIPADHHSRSTNRHAHMEEISRKIAALPSAYIPGKTTSGDWIYEACRIAALIYTTAILTKVPFSVAAEDEYTLDTVHINNIYRTGSPSHSRKPHLTEALFEVLKRTDTGNLWNDMSGVLYWVTAVGAAAARRPATMDLSPRVRFWQEEYSIWVRRCLTMHSTRAMIVLIFRHPIPILLAQKRLMRVQELLGISVHQPLFEL